MFLRRSGAGQQPGPGAESGAQRAEAAPGNGAETLIEQQREAELRVEAGQGRRLAEHARLRRRRNRGRGSRGRREEDGGDDHRGFALEAE